MCQLKVKKFIYSFIHSFIHILLLVVLVVLAVLVLLLLLLLLLLLIIIIIVLLEASHKNYIDIFTVTSLLNKKRLPIITIIIIHTLKID